MCDAVPLAVGQPTSSAVRIVRRPRSAGRLHQRRRRGPRSGRSGQRDAVPPPATADRSGPRLLRAWRRAAGVRRRPAAPGQMAVPDGGAPSAARRDLPGVVERMSDIPGSPDGLRELLFACWTPLQACTADQEARCLPLIASTLDDHDHSEASLAGFLGLVRTGTLGQAPAPGNDADAARRVLAVAARPRRWRSGRARRRVRPVRGADAGAAEGHEGRARPPPRRRLRLTPAASPAGSAAASARPTSG